MASTTVRVTPETHRILRELAEEGGLSLQATIREAVEMYRHSRQREGADPSLAALRADPEAWQDELGERAEWAEELPRRRAEP